MGKTLTAKYVVSFQTEPFHQARRYHWMICRADNCDELVSWGHELTRELAEAAAEKEVQMLASKTSQGGSVSKPKKSLRRRRFLIGAAEL